MDPTELANTVLPYLGAVAGAYGSAVLAKVRDQAGEVGADATVGLGRRLLQRLLGRAESAPAIEGSIVDLADDPADEDNQAAVRKEIKKALRADEQLGKDLAALLTEAGVPIGKYTVTISGSQGVQVGDRNTQTNTFGAGSS